MEEEIKKIWNAKLDDRIHLEHCEYLKEVRFDQSSSSKEYSWVAYNKDTYARAIFPLTNSNWVTHFKTMNGAKRNFLKEYYPKEIVAKITLLKQPSMEGIIIADKQNPQSKNEVKND